MEKILNTNGLGVSGRQNELIELALTYKFSSVEVDMNDLIGRHDTMGKEFACQFLQSAKIDIGTFELPIDLDSSDADFETACKHLDTIFALCATLGGKRCRISIATSSDEAFQANFERHRSRLFDLGEKFAAGGMKLGLALSLPTADEKDNKFIHTPEELLTLVKTVGHDAIGLYLNTWFWQATGGGMDQITELDVAKITELAMADLSEGADPASMNSGDRCLPGDVDPSFSVKVFEHLKSAGYPGPVSFSTHMSTFANVNRDIIVNRISKRLDCLIAGESFESIDERPVSASYMDSRDKDRAAKEGDDAKAEGKDAPADDKDAKADSTDAKSEGDGEAKQAEESKTVAAE